MMLIFVSEFVNHIQTLTIRNPSIVFVKHLLMLSNAATIYYCNYEVNINAGNTVYAGNNFFFLVLLFGGLNIKKLNLVDIGYF